MLKQNDKSIYFNNFSECIVLLESTFKRYKEKPRWELIQTMLRLAFQLGYEAARCEILHNMNLKDEMRKEKQ